MTLFKEINSLLFGLFLLVMSSLVYFQFTQARDFMSQQMKSDLNNTMTSLGLMLKPHLETGDMASAETLVNVIFEGGFYQRVTLKWLVNDKEQTWDNPVVIQGVPQWFVDLDLFEAQKEQTLITSGWMQLATLEIEGHPALGYQELWRVMNDTLMILSLLFILSILAVRVRLNRILKPLHQVAEQAKEIAQCKFGQDIEVPKTRELKDVVGAINVMSGQLKHVFSTLDQEIHELKEEKLIDRVSGLANRQYLSAQMHNWLDEPGYGGLILAKLDCLEEIYAKYGYQGRDEMIMGLAKRMQLELPEIAEGIIARIANTEFAFLLTRAERQQMELYLQTLIRLINQEVSKAGCPPNSNFALGVSQRVAHMSVVDLLSQSDNALQQALRDNKISQWLDTEQAQRYSREQWRTKLLDAINNKQSSFQWQAIFGLNMQKIIQREMYCRLTIDQELVRAFEFMPFVELLSLGSQLDRCLLESIEQQKLLEQAQQPVAINLTHDSLQDGEFVQWLGGFLKKSPYARRMLFEIPEPAVLSAFGRCRYLAETVRSAGAKVGIDQCGRQLGSLDYLQKLQPDYIKLDQSFVFYEKSNQSLEMCRALINVARGLNINVIITGIEDQLQLEHFSSLKADGYQGYISTPEDVLPETAADRVH
ncbi:EAL domain-containing protein [Thalassomonas viridans]|uniref:EAL domain-containing protein n=1 Tax=Thalassomonas viridans TaxID=137584 RepID=A0AAE9Z859_9GAMM|nr:EAL domain-containing protein [Thalassomonas viridans]WDE08531.1 EAL domain-containing protein [Thalassomonas viridans]